jgi:hypothetical protein
MARPIKGNVSETEPQSDLTKEIASERETDYLLRSRAMRQRLLEARERQDGILFDEVRQKLGI